MKKINHRHTLIFVILSLCLYGQDSYVGSLNFNYSGSMSGAFQSGLLDTLPGGGALVGADLDSTWIVVSALEQTSEDSFNLFLAFMQDTMPNIHSRVWSVADNDLENITFLMLYAPDLDSSFVTGFSDLFSDSSANLDSILSEMVQNLLDVSYISTSGILEISTVSDSGFSGHFNGSFLRGELTWPMDIITVYNGLFSMETAVPPALDIETIKPFPQQISLDAPYPNPFNPRTTIRFSVVETPLIVSLHIFDINGRLIETLVQGKIQSGIHEIQWNASGQASGIYFAVLHANNQQKTQKLILLK